MQPIKIIGATTDIIKVSGTTSVGIQDASATALSKMAEDLQTTVNKFKV